MTHSPCAQKQVVKDLEVSSRDASGEVTKRIVRTPVTFFWSKGTLRFHNKETLFKSSADLKWSVSADSNFKSVFEEALLQAGVGPFQIDQFMSQQINMGPNPINFTIEFEDGYGCSPEHGWSGWEPLTLESCDIINCKYEMTPGLAQLLRLPYNRSRIEAATPQLHQLNAAYRCYWVNERVRKENTMSNAFVVDVFNNDACTKQELMQRLQAEPNPLISQYLVATFEPHIDVAFEQLASFDKSSQHARWFAFWHDVWQMNQDVEWISEHPEMFDPAQLTSIARNLMQRQQLEEALQRFEATQSDRWRGNWFDASVIDRLYGKIQSSSASSSASVDGDAVSAGDDAQKPIDASPEQIAIEVGQQQQQHKPTIPQLIDPIALISLQLQSAQAECNHAMEWLKSLRPLQAPAWGVSIGARVRPAKEESLGAMFCLVWKCVFCVPTIFIMKLIDGDMSETFRRTTISKKRERVHVAFNDFDGGPPEQRDASEQYGERISVLDDLDYGPGEEKAGVPISSSSAAAAAADQTIRISSAAAAEPAVSGTVSVQQIGMRTEVEKIAPMPCETKVVWKKMEAP